MPDYPLYMARAGIGRASFTQTLRVKYPLFSKVQASMVCQPEKYGMQLLPEAERHLAAVYGSFGGLSIREPQAVRARPVRTKPHRLVVYLSDSDHDRVRGLMERLGYTTVQGFLCDLLKNITEIEERSTP